MTFWKIYYDNLFSDNIILNLIYRYMHAQLTISISFMYDKISMFLLYDFLFRLLHQKEHHVCKSRNIGVPAEMNMILK